MQCSMCRYLGDSPGIIITVIDQVGSLVISSYHPSYPSLRNYFDCQINVTLIIWPELQPPTTTRRGIYCQTMCSLQSTVKDGRKVSFPFPFVFVCSHGGGGVVSAPAPVCCVHCCHQHCHTFTSWGEECRNILHDTGGSKYYITSTYLPLVGGYLYINFGSVDLYV